MKTVINFLWKYFRLIIVGVFELFRWLGWQIWKGAKWLWKRYPEVYSVPAAFVMYWFSAWMIRLLDPTSAVFDGGVLQIPLFAILLLFLFLSVSWITMGLLFGTARKFLKTELKESFSKLTAWQKIRYSTGIFFILFLSLALLSFILA